VAPDSFFYDSQSRVIRTVEPDAGESRTYYDIAGRVRATQTQRQIDSKAYTVIGYDLLDRIIYSGEWKTDRGSAAVRAYFNEIQNQNNPVVDSLTPGTVTRTFYDKVPTDDSLNALNTKIIPNGENLKYTRGRVVAVVSDAGFDDSGNPIRISTANSYDKYGRVVKTFSYDPTMPVDSLKFLAVETEYDIAGKTLSTTKYPYGLSTNGKTRQVSERYVYDRLGRISDIYSKNGIGNNINLAHYEYYPTGNIKTVVLGNSLTLSYTYHISGAVNTATVESTTGDTLYSESLYYEDCGNDDCSPQYNGNISRMVHKLAHGNKNYNDLRDVRYAYDKLNRLVNVKDLKQPLFDEEFIYDSQGRIYSQRRADNINNNTGGEYIYYPNTNRLKSVTLGVGGSADNRKMDKDSNFVYDSEGNLIEDKSKSLKILYDWRGMPIEFTQTQQPTGSSSNTLFKLLMRYDGNGRRISKTVMHKAAGDADWDKMQVTHYTGIGTEVREDFSKNQTKVVVNMPQGLGRYGIEDASSIDYGGRTGDQLAGYISNAKFEWYLKNHLGSTMLVYGTQADANPAHSDIGTPLAAYDYRAFGEMIELTPPPTGKVTENFTGKEHDDEIALDYFGARYLDPMLGMWISVDPARQFASPYLYAGNGMNPIGGLDPSGTYFMDYDGNVTEGEFVSPEFQGLVSPDELIELQYAIEKFMESPGNVETLYSMAKYTLNHDVETRYWYDSKGQNNFAFGKSSCVLAGLGSGFYIHVHNWRPWSDMGSEGLSPSDVDWSNSNGSMMAYEIRSGHVYYTNISLPKQYRIMTIPMGGVLDATEFKGPMQDARPSEPCETKEIK
jgi:RHS repeat-associated protein